MLTSSRIMSFNLRDAAYTAFLRSPASVSLAQAERISSPANSREFDTSKVEKVIYAEAGPHFFVNFS